VKNASGYRGGFLRVGYRSDTMHHRCAPVRPQRRTALSPPTPDRWMRFSATGFGSKNRYWKKSDMPAVELRRSPGPEFNEGAPQYSSVTVPRGIEGPGASMASNSSRIQPAPTPSVSRPPDRTSMVERILAVSTAGRCGTTMTEVTETPGRVVFRGDPGDLGQLFVAARRGVPLGNSPEAL